MYREGRKGHIDAVSKIAGLGSESLTFFFTAKLLKSLEYSKSCFHYDFSEVMMKMFVE